MFCPKCRMANADTRVSCTKCGAKLPAVPGAADRASPDATARKLADEWNAGLSLTAAVAAARKTEPDASDGEAIDLSEHALTLGIAPDPVFVTATRSVVRVAPPKPSVPTSRNAKLSFGLGIFSVIPPVAVYAIRYGFKGRAEVRESEGRVKGRALATAGLILGWLGVGLFTCAFGLELYAHNHRSAKAANESAAIGNLRAVSTALVSYASAYQNGFPSTLNPLTESAGQAADCNHAGLLAEARFAGQYSGYVFHYRPLYPDSRSSPAISPKAAAANCVSGGASGYSLVADPIEPGKTGVRHFFIDQTGIIRYSMSDKPVDANSPSLQ
jgi:Domain of unknown function (DUF4190)